MKYGFNIEHDDVAQVAIRVGVHSLVAGSMVRGRFFAPEYMSTLLHHGVQLVRAGLERTDGILQNPMLVPS